MTESVDVAIVGAGAAGLMAGIWAGRANPNRSIVLLDGAGKLGAKILVSGGGRCNVTHDTVDASAYAGSTRPAIAKVLRRFDVSQTVQFFAELGVQLKREPTGKLFPVTDRSQSVLDALLAAAQQTGAGIQHPRRVAAVQPSGDAFLLSGDWGQLTARCVVLATGGRSLPKSGSDGHGYELAQALGHTLAPSIFPALVPLTLPPDHFLRRLSGVATQVTVAVRTAAGKQLIAFTDSLLCTHFGLSGPAILDISRYYLAAVQEDPGTELVVNWLPNVTSEELDAALQGLGATPPLAYLRPMLPERLARGLLAAAGVEPGWPGHQLTRSRRRALTRAITALAVPITGSRGFAHAEVTAGGVPLAELHLATLESRLCPGLYLCGEICDVDGRIGGNNFQWAWASGYVAGVSV